MKIEKTLVPIVLTFCSLCSDRVNYMPQKYSPQRTLEFEINGSPLGEIGDEQMTTSERFRFYLEGLTNRH